MQLVRIIKHNERWDNHPLCYFRFRYFCIGDGRLRKVPGGLNELEMTCILLVCR